MNPSTQQFHRSSDPTRTLPPLILHPFAEAGGQDKLKESQRASLMLQGLLPPGETTEEDLDRALLDGRYSEILMLFYVGKDLVRWIEQCLEHIARQPDLGTAASATKVSPRMLVNHTPARCRPNCGAGESRITVPFSCARWA